MRFVFINHSHPSMPHVSGLRAWRFAQELAGRGHRVALICEWRDGAAPAPAMDQLAAAMEGHDWTTPFVIAIPPVPVELLSRVRSPLTGALTRKVLVARSYLTASGMFTDFSQAAQPYLERLAGAFSPQAVWGTFGNTDCWLMAQRLARLSRCGWIGDMKDAWDWWIPPGLRFILARRFRDMSAGTANAAFHATAFERWFPVKPAVVYSGVDEEWITAAPAQPDGFRVMLVGGLYGAEDFRRFINGLTEWVRSKPASDRARISLCYAGSDASRVEAAARDLARDIRVDIRGYVPLRDLASLCQGAGVNAYLWSPTTFHHKLVELLCCRRPIISFPGEREESVALASQAGGSLNVCGTEAELRSSLEAAWQGALEPASVPAQLLHLTWAAQADRLERVLADVAQGSAA